MKPSDLVELLHDFYAAKLRLKGRHEAAARLVGQYDVNNTYQYVINREDAHIEWLRRAITSLGAAVPGDEPPVDVPDSGKGAAEQAAISEEDARLIQEFLDRWRPRVEQVTDSRQRIMLGVILGEMLEQKRFFEQAQAGRTDLLGRRTSPSKASGTVLGTRWVE